MLSSGSRAPLAVPERAGFTRQEDNQAKKHVSTAVRESSSVLGPAHSTSFNIYIQSIPAIPAPDFTGHHLPLLSLHFSHQKLETWRLDVAGHFRVFGFGSIDCRASSKALLRGHLPDRSLCFDGTLGCVPSWRSCPRRWSEGRRHAEGRGGFSPSFHQRENPELFETPNLSDLYFGPTF